MYILHGLVRVRVNTLITRAPSGNPNIRNRVTRTGYKDPDIGVRVMFCCFFIPQRSLHLW
jgi:hypothetical protein